jgi:hypothetical protein
MTLFQRSYSGYYSVVFYKHDPLLSTFFEWGQVWGGDVFVCSLGSIWIFPTHSDKFSTSLHGPVSTLYLLLIPMVNPQILGKNFAKKCDTFYVSNSLEIKTV